MTTSIDTLFGVFSTNIIICEVHSWPTMTVAIRGEEIREYGYIRLHHY